MNGVTYDGKTITLNGVTHRNGEWVDTSVELAKQSDGTWRATRFGDILLDTYNASKSGAAQSRNFDTYEPGTAARAKLSDEEIAELAGKYDTSHMTQEQYDAFLDELVEKGALSRTDTKWLGRGGLQFLDIDPEDLVTGKGGWAYVESGDYLKRTLEDADGDLTVWLANMMARLEQGIDPSTKEGSRQKSEALSALSDIVQRMKSAHI